jgi:hypothetical protein
MKKELKIEALIHKCKLLTDKMPDLYLRPLLVFWNMILFSLLEIYKHFEGTFCLYFQDIIAMFRNDVD